ncbi:uncharacterized protein KNAG_0H01850 [Huiozyma naganishii CBS 8797]|uniref:BAR domain-containing protein n=1 Tax=Huiozyma naganishii (strain ATCC MYA-139 / BCRC 22969 / CBS 8797 / KCTC 17520 / NBRC 10181 / NCYC 3082 / Yp74L-3) TaxID=1071383 RepID=J7S8K5_HUIN7|nr:hypothetical protein KNAG_0H01850 [Kazachstania naganishii CBS 8797]CCK71599.1 hypothetical protein KNAG_0H01850 [Kazachstania naganishii CBS 8797]
MSWGGFKKAVNRAGNSVIIKDVDKVNDREFDLQERRFRVLESAGVELQKESRSYLSSLRVMAAAQVTVAESIASLYEGTNYDGVRKQDTTNVANYYLQCVQDFETDVVKRLDEPLSQTVIDPVTKFAMYFTEIDEAIKKRDHKQKDYVACKAKVRKSIDKPLKDTTKLPRLEKELQVAREIYDGLNEQLKVELPQLIALRCPYYDPSFEALIKIQTRFCTEGYSRLSQIQRYIDPKQRDAYSNGVLDGEVGRLLAQMQDLDIYKLGLK